MKCDKCNIEYKEHELETIRQSKARMAYGFNDNRLGNYHICVNCKSKSRTKKHKHL